MYVIFLGYLKLVSYLHIEEALFCHNEPVEGFLVIANNIIWAQWPFKGAYIEQTSKCYCYSANHESYQMDCFAIFAKSALRIRLFWRNCKKWQNNPTDKSDGLLSWLETILHVL